MDGRVLVAGSATAEIYDPLANSWLPTNSMTVSRSFHAAALLSDGRVLVAGGTTDFFTALAGAEIYDPTTNTWSAAASMNQPRESLTATLLQDGRVLITGGWDGASLSSAEIYDPMTNSWLPAPSMNASRSDHDAFLLQDGRVLIVGGCCNNLASVDIYDPSTDSWSSGGSTSFALWGHAAALLNDGSVLITGGIDPMGGSVSETEIYNPSTNSWSFAGSMVIPRWWHAATLLMDGSVLVTGGGDDMNRRTYSAEIYDPSAINNWVPVEPVNSGLVSEATRLLDGRVLFLGPGNTKIYNPSSGSWTVGAATSIGTIDSATLLLNGRVLVAGQSGNQSIAEIFDPVTNSWSAAASMTTLRHSGYTASRLADGRVLVVGGCCDAMSGYPMSSAEIYDPAANTWSAAASMTGNRYLHTATVLLDGRVLVTGGVDEFALSTAEIYDPKTNTWSSAGSMNTARLWHTATLLLNGSVLVIGYWNDSIPASAQVYQPSTNTWSPTTGSPTGGLSFSRYGHTADLLPDGSVLVAGGWAGGPSAASEIYNPATNAWSFTYSMITGEYFHSAVSLLDGSVLVVNGDLSKAQVFFPLEDQTVTFRALKDKTYGAPDFSLSARASSGLAVSFISLTTANCTVSGTIVHIVQAGVCTIRASQSGNLNFNAAPNVDRSFTIKKANQSITFARLSAKKVGDADFTVGASASSSLNVTFASLTQAVCTVSGNTVHIVKAGICTLRASQAGNVNYKAAPGVSRSFTVRR
jgi:N-acetylneuraminic acid mutarotase